MEITLLGTLAAHLGGTPWTPSAAKHRQVLALLALRAGHTVPMWELVDELWGDSPPRSAQATLQTYMMQLRRAISAAGAKSGAECRVKEILATTHGGYVLNIGSGFVDALEHESLAAAGLLAARRGHHPRASELLNQAISLWRGNALSDIAQGPPLKVETLRLEESRLSVLETCVAVDLAAGHTAEVLSRLTELTARYPMHERFHLQLMVTQYQVGRIWQALETYRRLHTRLVTELGLEPSEAVRDAHQRMLRRDPTLTLDVAGNGGPVVRGESPFGQLRSA